ncbi:hypothetical protein [Thaumasiovibrio subtropicus]|uniref:hypothetical protein n=1 Tax=Thaumasiovibrio subtropicus TaxID=1891207 RepID=UPI000B35C827|nr:hypothetical protein [Thaumasiovibrio subtropicus]
MDSRNKNKPNKHNKGTGKSINCRLLHTRQATQQELAFLNMRDEYRVSFVVISIGLVMLYYALKTLFETQWAVNAMAAGLCLLFLMALIFILPKRKITISQFQGRLDNVEVEHGACYIPVKVNNTNEAFRLRIPQAWREKIENGFQGQFSASVKHELLLSLSDDTILNNKPHGLTPLQSVFQPLSIGLFIIALGLGNDVDRQDAKLAFSRSPTPASLIISAEKDWESPLQVGQYLTLMQPKYCLDARTSVHLKDDYLNHSWCRDFIIPHNTADVPDFLGDQPIDRRSAEIKTLLNATALPEGHRVLLHGRLPIELRALGHSVDSIKRHLVEDDLTNLTQYSKEAVTETLAELHYASQQVVRGTLFAVTTEAHGTLYHLDVHYGVAAEMQVRLHVAIVAVLVLLALILGVCGFRPSKRYRARLNGQTEQLA